MLTQSRSRPDVPVIPGTLVAATVTLAVTVALAGFILSDRWDCFRGVPNCD